MIPIEQLKTIPLFASLSDEHLALLIPLFHRVRHKLRDVVFKQGDEGDAFYVLESGTLRVRHIDARSRERVLNYVSPPGCFGETSLLTGLPHDVTVDVFSDEVTLLILPKHEFNTLLNQHPEIKDDLAISPEVQKKLVARAYPWLSPGEIVIVDTRRHWFALVLMLRIPAVVALVLLILAAGGSFLNVGANVLWVILCLWSLGALAWTILDWSNDYYIVTNKRVIHTEKMVFFFEEREEAPIDRVTNIQEYTRGFWSRLLGYIDLHVETAGRQVDIDFAFAPRNKQIRQHIFDQLDRARARVASERRERMRAGIREELYDRLEPDPTKTPAQAATMAGAQAAAAIAAAMAGAQAAAAVAAAPPPPVIRRRRVSGLGKRLNNLLGLRIEEEGRITWRKHWFVLFQRASRPFLALVGVSFIGLLLLLNPPSGLTLQMQTLLLAIWVIALSATGFWLWYRYEDWRNDIYRVTDDRIVDVERTPFGLHERVAETMLDRIQDIKYVKPSLHATVFNYGNLVIETAGGQGQLTFDSVPDPRAVSQELFRRREAYHERQQQQVAREQRSDFLDWFMEYHHFLRERGDVRAPSVAAPAPGTPPDQTTDDGQQPQ